jgi:hypothetical protein
VEEGEQNAAETASAVDAEQQEHKEYLCCLNYA